MKTVRPTLAGGVIAALIGLLTILAPTAAQASTSSVKPATASCAAGEFCVYTGTSRTGTNCANYNNAAYLGQCTNEEESVYNNGTQCSGCDGIKMYWARDYLGAYAPLARGGYYANLTNDTFGYCGAGGTDSTKRKVYPCSGQGYSLWKDIASSSWY